jgi:DHA3 family tetracycline resistance protein-like MFS transporter
MRSTPLKKPSAYIVYLVMRGAITLASTLMFTVLAVYYVQSVGMSPLQLVLVGTVLEVTILLFEVPTGVVADTFSRRLSVIIGTFILGVAFLLEGAVALVGVVLLAEAIRGVGETFLSGATDAWLADEVGEEAVGHIYQRAAQIDRAVAILGTLASVALASIALNLPVLLGGGVYLALGIFLALYMPERGFHPARREERSSWSGLSATLRDGSRVVRRSPILLMLLGVSLFAGAAGEGFDRLWEAHFLINFRFPELGAFKPVVWFGVIGVGTQLASLIVAATLRRQLDAISQSQTATARALLVLGGLSILGVVGFALAGDFGLALAAFGVKEVAGSLLYPLYNTWLVRQIDPRVRATVLSMRGQLNALGQAGIGPAIGAVGNRSLRAALVIAGLLITPTLALYTRALRHNTPTAGPTETQVVPQEV